MSMLDDTIAQITALDPAAMAAARARQAQLTKPAGSLGRLEDLAVQIAGITGQARPSIERPVVIVMAADHGVARQGVSAYPAEVTPQMVANFLYGRAPINVLARQSLYITMLLLSAGGTALVVGLSGRFAQQLRQPRWAVACAGLVLVGAVLVLVLPNNPDAVTAPMELINNFRVRSIIGLTLFWAIFGTTFGWLTQRNLQRTTARSVVALS